MESKQYTVTVRFQHPAWDEKDGIKYEVIARTKAEANKQVRRRAYDDGHTVGRKATFTATPSQDEV